MNDSADTPIPECLVAGLDRHSGLLAGIPLEGVAGCTENDLLVAVTEKRTSEDIELFGEALAAFARGEEVGL